MRHFSANEFLCKCGCGKGIESMDEDFLWELDKARGIAEVPFVLTSAFRCKEYNLEISIPTSSHVKGLAVDIACTASYNRFKIVQALIKVGIDRWGVRHDFIHCDSDPDKPRELFWVY